MKISELTLDFIRDYLELDEDIDENEKNATDKRLNAYMTAAINYASNMTGLPAIATEGEDSLENHEDITIAVLTLIADFNENRIYTTEKSGYENKTADSILAMHRRNFI